MASLSRLGVVAGFLAVAALCLPLADLTVAGHDPWAALARMDAAASWRPISAPSNRSPAPSR